jgi:hypothetical protein
MRAVQLKLKQASAVVLRQYRICLKIIDLFPACRALAKLRPPQTIDFALTPPDIHSHV